MSIHTVITGSTNNDGSGVTNAPSIVADDAAVVADTNTATALGVAVFVARMLLGFTFLWAFLDKAFGFGYSTPSANAWIHGGSPTNGFLAHVEVGPFQSLFRSLAGNVIVDWLFMLGLLAIGLALLAGVALRLMAISGTVMLVLMWAAEWPLAKFDSTGAPTSSVNPIVDYHLIYAIALIMIALYAGNAVWGLGDRWRKIPVVARNRWLW